MKLHANAKLNLYLDVLRKRTDGYHDLDMIMQSVKLSDTVYISHAKNITVSLEGIKQEDNIAYRAAKAFFDRTGLDGASIRIKKRIPLQAGLAGGSADAAAVLNGLNALFEHPLTKQELFDIAKDIGSDVPFMMVGGCARVSGVGDKLEPFKNNMKCHYLIVKPKKGVSTAEAFSVNDAQPSIAKGNILACIDALKAGDIKKFSQNTKNALEDAARKICAEIDDALTFLRQSEGCGAAFMTGSGSACVGVFHKKKNALTAQREAQQGLKYEVFMVKKA